MNNAKQPLISHDDFWQFSVKFYGYKNNKTILLELQDLADKNVNLVLFACLLASIQFPFNNRIVLKLMESITETDCDIKLFRQERRGFKSAHLNMNVEQQDEYRKLLNKELQLEKLQQASLLDCYNTILSDLNLDVVQNKKDESDNKTARVDYLHYLTNSLEPNIHNKTASLLDMLDQNLHTFFEENNWMN